MNFCETFPTNFLKMRLTRIFKKLSKPRLHFGKMSCHHLNECGCGGFFLLAASFGPNCADWVDTKIDEVCEEKNTVK